MTSEVLAWAKQFVKNSSIQALSDITAGKYDRTTMSQYINGKYPASVSKIEAVLRPLMTQRLCPFLNKEITADDCKSRQSRPKPHRRGSAMEAHWLACQSCEFKEKGG